MIIFKKNFSNNLLINNTIYLKYKLTKKKKTNKLQNTLKILKYDIIIWKNTFIIKSFEYILHVTSFPYK
jgi:hypothetical protein